MGFVCLLVVSLLLLRVEYYFVVVVGVVIVNCVLVVFWVEIRIGVYIFEGFEVVSGMVLGLLWFLVIIFWFVGEVVGRLVEVIGIGNRVDESFIVYFEFFCL